VIEMAKFRKKPVVIEAIQLKESNIFEVTAFIDGKKPSLGSSIASHKWEDYVKLVIANEGVTIKTLEGDIMADFGDYVIKGVKGEFYPCKPDIFKLTYDAVD
jgi:hypothetical protein